MNDPIVYLNGQTVPLSKASVSVLDRGLTHGDGVFETIRAYCGQPFMFDRHARRMFGSLQALRIPIPETPSDLENACQAVLDANELTDAGIRITITRGVVDGPFGLNAPVAPTRIIVTRPVGEIGDLQKNGIAAVIAGHPFTKAPALVGHKTLNYLPNLIAKQEAIDAQAIEAIWTDDKGMLVEGATSNLFVVTKGQARTPLLATGALPGVTRDICIKLLLENGVEVIEEPIHQDMIPICDELFLTGSVAEVIPVVQVGQTTVGCGRPGPVALLLAKKYRELVERACDKPRP
jgi:branched-chain amino acid aminotransferase